MKKVNVTKSGLPPIEEYVSRLEKIWESGHLTNNGPNVQELEQLLAKEFGVKHVLLVCNATMALQLTIKALDLKGEILTTPFSFVATASSITWEGCRVKFADIEPATLCISPDRARERMNSNVSAIIATHVFGNPCEVESLDAIAKEWGIPVIYDAAHTYGVELNGKSIMQFGDVSVLSLHATKLFHSVEGGVIATNEDALARKLRYMRNFGFDGPEAFQGLGTNAKMSEFHAAMGLCLHSKIPDIIADREVRVARYDVNLDGVKGIRKQLWNGSASHNFAYYPLILPRESDVQSVIAALEILNISARRYFYPSLTSLSYVPDDLMPIAESISKRILCLPLYPELDLEDVDRISCIVIEYTHEQIQIDE